jgi:hypothetical protein
VSKRQARRGPSLQAGHRGGDRWAANPKGRGDKAVAGSGDEPSPPRLCRQPWVSARQVRLRRASGRRGRKLKQGVPQRGTRITRMARILGGGKLIPQSGTDMLKSKANVQGPKPKVKGDEGRVRFRRGRGR